MVTDGMTILSHNNFPLLEIFVNCFLVILDILLHHLILGWVCKANSAFDRLSLVILPCTHYLA